MTSAYSVDSKESCGGEVKAVRKETFASRRLIDIVVLYTVSKFCSSIACFDNQLMFTRASYISVSNIK